MMPGMNPKMMKQAMTKLGMQQEEVDATKVIIETPSGKIIIADPSVTKVNMMGQDTWQITGAAVEEAKDVMPDISDEDIKTVMEQTGVDAVTAKAAIEVAEGDLAAAILGLTEDE